ncbi:MAG TPA: aspartate aminotransferase family protein [Candidatus Binataceae bacterium]|nr:aspartate aminotransferase family protein [Candidatus Binataceae bacterium]
MTAMAERQVLFLRGAYGEPLHIVRAEGAWLYTRDGRKLLDASSGAIVVNVGQGRSELAELAREQVARLDYVLPIWVSPPRERLVEHLARWTPPGLDRFFFTSGGSEAVESALKCAFLYHRVRGKTGKTRVISRQLSYHGNTLGALSVSGNRARRADFEHVLFDWPKIPPSYCYRCPWGRTYPGCDLECAHALEEAIARDGADRIAAFIAEPMVGASGGVILPVSEYWPRIAEICRRHDIILIADEVMTGFGRTGKRFAVEHWGVNPDIIVGGKGLTGGYVPMGMIAVSRRVIEICEQAGADFMFFTYTAHPLACAIADKVLEIMEQEQLVEHAARVGARLGDRLKEELGSHPMTGEIRGAGLFWGIEVVADRATRRPFAPSLQVVRKLLRCAMDLGVAVYPAAGMAGDQGGDAIMIAPPFVIGDSEVELIVTTLRRCFDSTWPNLPHD